MRFLVDNILVQSEEPLLNIRKKVAERLGAHLRGLQIEIIRRRWVRMEEGGAICLTVIAETNEFLRNTSTFAFPGINECDTSKLDWKVRPVVAGFGIPGIIAALYLAKRGLKPIVLERGCGLHQESARPKAKVTLTPDGEGGVFAQNGATLSLDLLDTSLRVFLESEGIVFEGTDCHRLLSAAEVRSLILTMHQKILAYGGEIHFGATYLGVKKRFGKIKAVVYESEGVTKLIKTDKLLLTYGACNDVFYIGTSIPASPLDFNECIYGKKYVDSNMPIYLSTSETRLGQSGRGICITGLNKARVVDIGSPSEMCLQAFNYDQKGRYVHTFIAVESTKEEAENICKNAYDATKAKKVPCSTVADFMAKRTPLRLGATKPERITDIRLESFPKLLGPTFAKRFASAISQFSKTHPYLLEKDAVLEGLLILAGCRDGSAKIIDGICVSRVPATQCMDFAARANAGFDAAQLLCR